MVSPVSITTRKGVRPSRQATEPGAGARAGPLPYVFAFSKRRAVEFGVAFLVLEVAILGAGVLIGYGLSTATREPAPPARQAAAFSSPSAAREETALPEESPPPRPPADPEVSSRPPEPVPRPSQPQNPLTIQIGSFLVASNAESLLRRLAASGYDVRIDVWNDSRNREWHIVRMGSYSSHAEARSALTELNEKERLSAIVWDRPW